MPTRGLSRSKAIIAHAVNDPRHALVPLKGSRGSRCICRQSGLPGTQGVGHRTADDLAAAGIEHDGGKQESCGRRNVGDIGSPQPVRAGSVPVSRANQAAAFERMSRSSPSCLFLRRSRTTSSRSGSARPAPPPPRAGHLSVGIWQPRLGWIDRLVQTPAQVHPDRARFEPDRPSGDEIQANTLVEIWASDTPLVKTSVMSQAVV